MPCLFVSFTLGPMKEKDLTPGTVFPVLGTLLFFLPERYREKLCCVTPLTQKVSSCLRLVQLHIFHIIYCVFNSFFTLADQPKQINTQPYQMAKKEGNGTAYCKEDMVTEFKEAESDRAETEDEDLDTKIALPSCQLTATTVQETAL